MMLSRAARSIAGGSDSYWWGYAAIELPNAGLNLQVPFPDARIHRRERTDDAVFRCARTNCRRVP